MTLVVDQPIINEPYQEPTRWWDYQEGQPVLLSPRATERALVAARVVKAALSGRQQPWVV